MNFYLIPKLKMRGATHLLPVSLRITVLNESDVKFNILFQAIQANIDSSVADFRPYMPNVKMQ